MSSIDFLEKKVVLTDGGFIYGEVWIAQMRADGYEIKDFRKALPEKRRASQE